mmetsp:Transcript_39466/g.54811  ORF Transcript_39466/g.54811 Transcript_39466/m.54811 type:complete len:264 (+) Transcript_39466:632-1423(+)
MDDLLSSAFSFLACFFSNFSMSSFFSCSSLASSSLLSLAIISCIRCCSPLSSNSCACLSASIATRICSSASLLWASLVPVSELRAFAWDSFSLICIFSSSNLAFSATSSASNVLFSSSSLSLRSTSSSLCSRSRSTRSLCSRAWISFRTASCFSLSRSAWILSLSSLSVRSTSRASTPVLIRTSCNARLLLSISASSFSFSAAIRVRMFFISSCISERFILNSSSSFTLLTSTTARHCLAPTCSKVTAEPDSPGARVPPMKLP